MDGIDLSAVTARPALPIVLRPAALSQVPAGLARPEVRGKFLFAGGEKLLVRGVTYGTFRPGNDGVPYPAPVRVDADFAAMRKAGLNAVRTYTVPPEWMLDAACRHGLRIMVGLPWEQHVTFLDERRQARDIERRVRAAVRSCAGHPAVLGYAVGNEIPAPIVRWHGRRRVESFLERLCDAAKAKDPAGLVTYVNYPTTEFLELPFLDLVTFNVYLEARESLEAYLARLQNLAGDRPLIMAEVGLDSLRNGEAMHADVLDWQVRAAFAAGCAGAFVFSWTDEWWRGGHEIEDWAFGLTTRKREPKPALAAVSRAFAEAPLGGEVADALPRISVVVCTHNGDRTIQETLEHLRKIDYPDYEIIVVNDGSTDGSVKVIRDHDVVLISTENRGLSSARNTGMQAARGEIIAYIDDDAYPDPHWLRYLAHAFRTGDWVGVGGPNVVPPEDPLTSQCVALAPGGPTHVLVSDRQAEHIPGCNMAFRKAELEAVGGFDPRFWTAGDDVDLCWRIQERGWKIGFHPGAMVWHHRRPSLWRYWKQQVGYGKAEALLESKWPQKYNSLGHLAWHGRIYGAGLTRALLRAPGRVYQGTFGMAPFQSLYERQPGMYSSIALTPEWYLVIGALAGFAALSPLWPPLRVALAPVICAAGLPIIRAMVTSLRLRPPAGYRSLAGRLKFHGVTALMHLVQPAARLWGRIKHGLTPWRNRCMSGWVIPWRRHRAIWSEQWKSKSDWLAWLESRLHNSKVPTHRGGGFATWDLGVRGGLFGGCRLLMTTEEHGAGKQYLRFRVWPRLSRGSFLVTLPSLVVAGLAVANGAVVAGLVIGAGALALGFEALRQCGAAEATVLNTVGLLEARISLMHEPVAEDHSRRHPDPVAGNGRSHEGETRYRVPPGKRSLPKRSETQTARSRP